MTGVELRRLGLQPAEVRVLILDRQGFSPAEIVRGYGLSGEIYESAMRKKHSCYATFRRSRERIGFSFIEWLERGYGNLL